MSNIILYETMKIEFFPLNFKISTIFLLIYTFEKIEISFDQKTAQESHRLYQLLSSSPSFICHFVSVSLRVHSKSSVFDLLISIIKILTLLQILIASFIPTFNVLWKKSVNKSSIASYGCYLIRLIASVSSYLYHVYTVFSIFATCFTFLCPLIIIFF
jgi:hypothetical protein